MSSLEIGQTFPAQNNSSQNITIVARITHPTHPFLGVITQLNGTFIKALPFNKQGQAEGSVYKIKLPVEARLDTLSSSERNALRGIVQSLNFVAAKPYLTVKFPGEERQIYDHLRAN